MLNSFQAHTVYKQAQKELSSPKGIELKVFMSVTSAIKAVNMDAPGAKSKLYEALLENAELWRVIFIDLINPENALPTDLKHNLISLADFTQKHTQAVLGGHADHQVLLDINESVIAGLRESVRANRANAQRETEAA